MLPNRYGWRPNVSGFGILLCMVSFPFCVFWAHRNFCATKIPKVFRYWNAQTLCISRPEDLNLRLRRQRRSELITVCPLYNHCLVVQKRLAARRIYHFIELDTEHTYPTTAFLLGTMFSVHRLLSLKKIESPSRLSGRWIFNRHRSY